MAQMTLFNYSDIALDTATEIRAAAERIRVRMKRSAEDIIAIGLDLIAVKERLSHGAFLPWIEAEFEMSENAARNFMRVANHYGSKSANIADLTPSVLYELAAPSTPEPIREIIEKKIENGEAVSVAEVKRLKQEAAELKRQVQAVEDDARQARSETQRADKEAERFKSQAETLLDNQRDLIAKARAEAKMEAESALQAALEKAEKNAQSLKSDNDCLTRLAQEAEKAAFAKAQAEAENLAAIEIAKHQKAVDEAEKELAKIRAEIQKRNDIKDRLTKEVEQHENYLRSMKNSDLEAKGLLKDLDELQRVIALTMVTVNDIEHEHGENVLQKLRSTATMCRNSAEVLDTVGRPRLVYEAEIVNA